MGKILMQGTGGGADLDLVTAKASDILQGKVIIGPDGEPLTGTIPILSARTITPGTGNQVINAGNYLGGNITVAGDGDLKAANIRQGVNLFGVAGTCRQFKTWTGAGNAPSSTRTKFPDEGGNTFYNYVLTVAPGFTPIVFVAYYRWQPDSITYPSWNALGKSCFVMISGENNGEILYSNLTVTAAKLTIPVPRAGDYTVHVLGY